MKVFFLFITQPKLQIAVFFQKNSYFNFQYKTTTQKHKMQGKPKKTNPIYATRVFQKPSCAITISQPQQQKQKKTQRKLKKQTKNNKCNNLKNQIPRKEVIT
ncbi:hypothetical protein [Candidatus Phytoplasma sp. AldY-WA1]|uniref:hypothetical protein n=1 Tax=Candidatus Phytoplasma sp. AldY-WA1 TaxID=2852100 RepID=UPI00254EB5F4|nr:hypothetical protein [Candidatus Phytoplasma sp. AldY-WA1]